MLWCPGVGQLSRAVGGGAGSASSDCQSPKAACACIHSSAARLFVIANTAVAAVAAAAAAKAATTGECYLPHYASIKCHMPHVLDLCGGSC